MRRDVRELEGKYFVSAEVFFNSGLNTLRCKSGAVALVPVELGEPSAYPWKADDALPSQTETQGTVSAIPAMFCDFLQTQKQPHWKTYFSIKVCF